MGKAAVERKPMHTGRRGRVRGSRTGWVRKNVAMDQRKLDAARRALGVATETEAIDLALDFVVDGLGDVRINRFQRSLARRQERAHHVPLRKSLGTWQRSPWSPPVQSRIPPFDGSGGLHEPENRISSKC